MTGHVCVGCGGQDKLFDRGYCDRCSLIRRTGALLSGIHPKVPAQLTGVRDAIVTTANPRTALNWLRTGTGAPLLAALANDEIPLSHTGLDTEPAGKAVEYLRALLVARGALPVRDEQLARLERRHTVANLDRDGVIHTAMRDRFPSERKHPPFLLRLLHDIDGHQFGQPGHGPL